MLGEHPEDMGKGPGPHVRGRTPRGSLRLCVPDTMTDEEIFAFAKKEVTEDNLENPDAVVTSGFRIRTQDDPRMRGDLERAPCREHEGHTHLVVDPQSTPIPVAFTLTPEESEEIKNICLKRPGATVEEATAKRERWWMGYGLAHGVDPASMGTAQDLDENTLEFWADPLTDSRRETMAREIGVLDAWALLPADYDLTEVFNAEIKPLIKELAARCEDLGLPLIVDVVYVKKSQLNKGVQIEGGTDVKLPMHRSLRYQREAVKILTDKRDGGSDPLALLRLLTGR